MAITLSKAAMEVEEWLADTYNYDISEVQQGGQGEYRFYVTEYGSFGNVSDTYFMTVEPDGRLLNDRGHDVVQISKFAYDYDNEIVQWLQAFEAKYYPLPER